MVKVGDTVRYLNDVGGGKVTRIDGKIAYVLDDGFENPVMAKDLVVVLPAGHEPSKANLMFDQRAFDAGKSKGRAPSKEIPNPKAAPEPKKIEIPVVETEHGDRLNIVLAFEPSSTRDLAGSTFNAVLVNDSNYYLNFMLASRSGEAKQWSLIFEGTVAPNELIDLDQFTHEDLNSLERVSVQGFAYKKDKPFELKRTIEMSRRLDLTKFYKLHCFRRGLYFDTPVLEVPVVNDDHKVEAPDASTLIEKITEAPATGKGNRKRRKDGYPSPTALLPIIEVDLHAHNLLDTTAGMNNTAILQYQLSTVRETLDLNSRRVGQKIVFIHGKGEGVLRSAVLDLIKKEFPHFTTQDASFREYGFGATLVTIHQKA